MIPTASPKYVARAFATAMNGRPGPVVLVLPEDMLTRRTAARPLPRVEPVRGWLRPAGAGAPARRCWSAPSARS